MPVILRRHNGDLKCYRITIFGWNRTMKMSMRDKAGISALWGTIFLFLLPITAGVLFIESDWQGAAAIAAVTLACLASAAVGAGFFFQAMTRLTDYSREKVRQGRQT